MARPLKKLPFSDETREKLTILGFSDEDQSWLAGVKDPEKIDEETVMRLALVGCTYEEIAVITGLDKSTVRRRFAHAIRIGHKGLQMSLKRKQIQMAMKDGSRGQLSMLMWLGKQYLGQKDKVEQTILDETRDDMFNDVSDDTISDYLSGDDKRVH